MSGGADRHGKAAFPSMVVSTAKAGED